MRDAASIWAAATIQDRDSVISTSLDPACMQDPASSQAGATGSRVSVDLNF